MNPLPPTCALLLVCFCLLAVPDFAQESDEPLAECADCHPSQASAYSTTGMARALGPLRAGELRRLTPVREEPTGFVYSFEGDGPGARLVESFAPSGARPPWRDSAAIAFAIGAGELDRSFVVERGGRLWLAPLEAVGHGGAGHAALAPSHSIAPGTRFTQPVTPECLGCHTDALPARTWPLNQAPASWMPRGISCAGCHGSLLEHVRVRSAELAGAEPNGADPLLAEREWPRVARMERCAACHLQGDARIELDPRSLGPPPPGTDLLARRAVFVAREPGDQIGFVSHVQRLVRSRCYLESRAFPRGGLACETCHDPHRSVFEAEERARVRGACLACHGPEGEPGMHATECALALDQRPVERDCVDCHLRRSGVFDVAEVAIHDHWIQREPGPPSVRQPLRFPESQSGDWTLFAWPGEPARFDAQDDGLWTLALAHGGHVERAMDFMKRGLGQRARELPMLHHVRGSLFERSGAWRDARAAYEQALARDPELAEATINLAPVLARLGDAQAAKVQLDRLLQRHALADSALRNRAVVRLALHDEAGALADLEAAMKLLPDATLAQALARIAEQRGDRDGVQRWSAEARRLDPRLP